MARCPVDRKSAWRRQCLLLRRVAMATARLFAAVLGLIVTTPPFFFLFFPLAHVFCDALQVAGEGHRNRSL